MPIPESTAHRLLIIDDDPLAIQALAQVMTGMGELRFALSGEEGLRLAAATPPDLILLDAELPDLDGLSVCRRLKADSALAAVPVIFVTSHDAIECEIDALDAGAADFIRKPPRSPVVRARVRTQLRLKELADALRRQAMLDGLTGVANRRGFDEALQREAVRARRGGQPLSLALVDVDHFKLYNDRYGHPAGDECLRRVARALTAVLQRPADLLARYGGEEFAILLPETGAEGALHIAQTLCDAVRAMALPHADSLVAPVVTASLGVATQLEPEPQPQALVQAADAALYQAKAGGRARVVASGGPA